MLRIILMLIVSAQAYLYIPAIGLWEPIGESPVIRGDQHDTSELGFSVMRLEYTTWNGMTDQGRTVLIGHSGEAFKDIDQLKDGDRIFIVSSEWSILEFVVYSRYETITEDVRLLKTPTNQYELVLITCSKRDQSKRLIIKARYVNG